MKHINLKNVGLFIIGYVSFHMNVLIYFFFRKEKSSKAQRIPRKA